MTDRAGGRPLAAAAAALVAGVAALTIAAFGVAHADARQEVDARAFLSWARSAAIPLQALRPTGADTDLAPVAAAIGSARVMALGEPGHGAQQPLAFRNRLFQYLVIHDGVTAIGLETSFTESRAVDEFVLGAPGDAATLARRDLSWGFGRYEANVQLIQWMRNYNENAHGRRKIHFYGVDMSGAGRGEFTHADITVRSVVRYLQTVAPESSKSVLQAIGPQLRLMDKMGYWQMALHNGEAVQTMLKPLVAYLSAHEAALRRASSQSDYDWAAHNLVVAGQLRDYLRLEAAPEGDSTKISPFDYRLDNVRDAAMATNVLWALHEEGSGGRLMVFAHDGHVMNSRSRGGIWSVYKEAPVMMGAHLRSRLGGQLVIIATLAAQSGGGLPTGDPVPDSVEVSLRSLHMPFFALDLRGARGNEGAMAWLGKRRPIRQNFDTELDVVPDRAFDVVVLLDRVSRAIMDGKRPWNR